MMGEREEREREGEGGRGVGVGWVMELLLEDGGRGLQEKLRVELQYCQ